MAEGGLEVSENAHQGTDFDQFLENEGLLEQCRAVAIKRVVAAEIIQAMEREGISKSAMAKAMGTSRASLHRLLDPESPSVTLLTLERAARALGKKLRIEFSD